MNRAKRPQHQPRIARLENLEPRMLLAVFNPLPHAADGAPDSLRAAILASNGNGQGDTINLQQGVYELSLLGFVQENGCLDGDLDITEPNRTLTIVGRGATSIIDARDIDRAFHVLGNARLVLRDVVVRGGLAQDDGTAGATRGSTSFSRGGGVLGAATSRLVLGNVLLDDNQAVATLFTVAQGGGIYSEGNVTINGSLIANNQAVAGGAIGTGSDAEGGGVFAAAGSSLAVNNSTLAGNTALGGNAFVSGAQPGIGGDARGGGVFSAGTLTFTNSRATGNRATGGQGAGSALGGAAQGGGLFLSGDATLSRIVIANNEANGGLGALGTAAAPIGGVGGIAQGGGAFFFGLSTIDVSVATFTNNRARGGVGGGGAPGAAGGGGGHGEGGGLYAEAGSVLRATFSGNLAAGGFGGSGGFDVTISGPGGSGGNGSGGGIYTAGVGVVVASSTVSSNTASGSTGGLGGVVFFGPAGISQGGGLYVAAVGSLTVRNSTVAANSAPNVGTPPASSFGDGGGVFDNGVVSAISTIIADNTATTGPDYSGAFDIADHVLLENNSGATGITPGVNGNLVGSDPQLGPLAHNGGPTQTHLPLEQSLAVNRGVNPLTLSGDQRGLPRVAGDQIDIGAVEVQAPIVRISGTTTYRENAPPLTVAPAAIVTHRDRTHFNDGTFVASIADNFAASDVLRIRNQGMGPGQIGVQGNNVFFGGTLIGAFAVFNADANETLFVGFSSEAATTAAVQALARAITFRTIGENPSPLPRTIGFGVFDDEGLQSDVNTASRIVRVVRVNDAPQLAPSTGATVGYVRGAPPVGLLTSAVVTDPDSPNFGNGKLVVRAISGNQASNRLLIGGGVFTLEGNQIRHNGLLIGTKNESGGEGQTRLEITFTSNATVAIVQQLVRLIRFRTAGASPTTQRVFEISLFDGDGGASNKVNVTVNVS